MAIRIRDIEEDEERERRKRVAIEALRSTGAQRVFAEEAAHPARAAKPATKPEPASAGCKSPNKRPTFDRTAYQRAYMRVWRARRKAREE
jgi:hypothetical protein